jgi:hypothetical protein
VIQLNLYQAGDSASDACVSVYDLLWDQHTADVDALAGAGGCSFLVHAVRVDNEAASWSCRDVLIHLVVHYVDCTAAPGTCCTQWLGRRAHVGRTRKLTPSTRASEHAHDGSQLFTSTSVTHTFKRMQLRLCAKPTAETPRKQQQQQEACGVLVFSKDKHGPQPR